MPKKIIEVIETFGTVEGWLESRDATFYIREALTERRVECRFGGCISLDEALSALGKRIAARGIIHSRLTGEKVNIEATEFRVFRSEQELPSLDDVQRIMLV